MSDRDEEIRKLAIMYVGAQSVIESLGKDIADLSRRRKEVMCEADAHAKALMQSVGRNLDERHIRVEDSVVHVRFDAERGPSVRLVKLS